MPHAVEVYSLNHWTTRGVQILEIKIMIKRCYLFLFFNFIKSIDDLQCVNFFCMAK